jgi:hypothetical protein
MFIFAGAKFGENVLKWDAFNTAAYSGETENTNFEFFGLTY